MFRGSPDAGPPMTNAAPNVSPTRSGSRRTWPSGVLCWLAVGGFDERFPRAYREDSDLALRIILEGNEIVQGSGDRTHPVAKSTLMSSVKAQIGNRTTR